MSVKSFARATAETSISIAPMRDFLYSKSALIFAYTSAFLCVKSITSRCVRNVSRAFVFACLY